MVIFAAKGLMAPVFTPINKDYTINYSVIPVYVDYLKKKGIKSILVGGTTGEHMCLSISDRTQLIKAWLDAAKDMHVQIQIGGAPLADVLHLAKFCSEIKVGSLLTLPELYFKPQTVDELVSYLKLVAEAAPNLPILYYHIPSLTNVNISMPDFVVAATRTIGNFRGIKFTSNDLNECCRVSEHLNEDQQVFLGADTLLAPAAIMGVKSSIGTTFNIFPHLAQGILESIDKDDAKTAKKLQNQLSAAVEAITAEGPWVPSMKTTMELVSGIKMGPPLQPQKAISEQGKLRIETKLKKMKLLI